MSAPEQFGDSYVFGFNGITPPEIPGFVMTEMNKDMEPEFMETATGGGGTVTSVTKTVAGQDKFTVTCTGYITDLDSFENEADNFTFNGRFFIIGKKGEKYKEKGYLVCDINCTSYYNVSAAAS